MIKKKRKRINNRKSTQCYFSPNKGESSCDNAYYGEAYIDADMLRYECGNKNQNYFTSYLESKPTKTMIHLIKDYTSSTVYDIEKI